ncbi:ThiF family adenylyltransferase [Nesterenkonia sp. CF4.4]|uniref:ThiF family adenylyltransferase n=1 Tax=Nesterenkonia sp. CF4.4 TaxID=3373079 RepID=UPI003EE5D25A
MVNFMPWWEQYPGRLEHERAALQSLGVTVREDAEARAQDVIRWTVIVPDEYTKQGDVQLIVTFPEFYPFLRPDVRAPDLDMAHHQHPFGNNLCLIGRSSSAWDTGNDLAWLIREQLHKALTSGVAEERSGDEENQGEPFSDYYSYTANAMALVDSAWEPRADAASGIATLRFAGHAPLQDEAPTLFVVESIADSDMSTLFSMPKPVTQHYENGSECKAQWVHMPTAVKASNAAGIWETAESFVGAPPPRFCFNNTQLELRLVSFPEEHSQTTTGTGWVLLVHELGRVIPPDRKARKSGNPARQKPRRAPSSYHLVRSGRIGPTDMRARIDSATGLDSKRVLLIGVGAVGSVIADQLSRAGIEGLTIIDHDVLEPGNLVRHANNLSFVGTAKSDAAAALARQANPYIEVSSVNYSVGSTAAGTEQRMSLAREYEQADLVIDATAEVGVQRLSAFLARRAGKPWIGAWATNGALGGAVVRVPASAPWCFSCFEWARLKNDHLQPPASPAPLTQPAGCAEPTFLGPGHDLNEVALHAARTALGVLSNKPTHDAAVLSLEHPGGADLPQWDTQSLTRHPECQHS